MVPNSIGRRASKACILHGIVLVLAAGLVAAGAQTNGYLPKVGPVALRFRQVQPQNFAILPALPTSDVPDRVTLAKNTRTPPLLPAGTAVWNPPYAYVAGPLYSTASSQLPSFSPVVTNSASSAPTANDLLGINPQMLVEYFKPAKGSPNSAGVSAYVPVQFTPATPAVSAPASSSTYRNQ